MLREIEDEARPAQSGENTAYARRGGGGCGARLPGLEVGA